VFSLENSNSTRAPFWGVTRTFIAVILRPWEFFEHARFLSAKRSAFDCDRSAESNNSQTLSGVCEAKDLREAMELSWSRRPEIASRRRSLAAALNEVKDLGVAVVPSLRSGRRKRRFASLRMTESGRTELTWCY